MYQPHCLSWKNITEKLCCVSGRGRHNLKELDKMSPGFPFCTNRNNIYYCKKKAGVSSFVVNGQ